MGNHRADRRSRKRAADVTVPTQRSATSSRATLPAAPAPARAETPAPGRRRAVPAQRAATDTAQRAATDTAQRATTETAQRATTNPTPRASRGGSRRAAKPAKQHVFAPAVPSILGAAALLAAAGGVLATGAGHLPATSGLQLSASAGLTGTDAVDDRARAISRDSARQALQDVVDQDLKDAVAQQSEQRNVKLASLAASAERRADQIAKNLWVVPTSGYRLTARFGLSSGLWSRGHTGIDFATGYGTPIIAIANGVITESKYDGAYGNKTVETLPDGTEIWYCHQSSVGIRVGDKVIQGQQIGAVGTTGNTTGPHVHIEVRPGGGDPVDPYAAFQQHGITP